MESFAEQAEDMLTNPATLAAFDIESESEQIKKLYHPNEPIDTPEDRPIFLAKGGQPIRELFR